MRGGGRQQAMRRRERDRDGWRNQQRLKNRAEHIHAMHGLHYLIEAGFNAVKTEAEARTERIGGDGLAERIGVREIVPGLLEGGSGEVGLSGLGVAGNGRGEFAVGRLPCD